MKKVSNSKFTIAIFYDAWYIYIIEFLNDRREVYNMFDQKDKEFLQELISPLVMDL